MLAGLRAGEPRCSPRSPRRVTLRVAPSPRLPFPLPPTSREGEEEERVSERVVTGRKFNKLYFYIQVSADLEVGSPSGASELLAFVRMLFLKGGRGEGGEYT